VILMAVPVERIRSHLDMLAEARLRPLHIEAEPLALFRAYQRFLRRAADESHVSVIVDIGLACTRVVVARGATTILVKTVGLGGHKLNESVAKELGLNYEEASHFRRRLGDQKSPQDLAGSQDAGERVEWSVLDAIRGQAEELAREISLCLRYCSVTFRGLRPAQMTLTGGESYDPALVKLLDEGLDFECVMGEPLRGVDLGTAAMGSDRRGLLTEWSVAAGLALRTLMDNGRSRKAGDETSRLSA
jgi:type IV pilus assembly protein PilM